MVEVFTTNGTFVSEVAIEPEFNEVNPFNGAPLPPPLQRPPAAPVLERGFRARTPQGRGAFASRTTRRSSTFS